MLHHCMDVFTAQRRHRLYTRRDGTILLSSIYTPVEMQEQEAEHIPQDIAKREVHASAT